MIIVVMGVSGSGKTTVGRMLADALDCPFLEGDTLHLPASVEKMGRGVPLTDADRAPWLEAVHRRLVDAHMHRHSLVVACSALKQSYRAVLERNVPIVWVYLKGSTSLIRARLQRRAGHYMKADMLSSQLDALEEPSDAIVADIAQPPGAIVEYLLSKLRPGLLDTPRPAEDRKNRR